VNERIDHLALAIAATQQGVSAKEQRDLARQGWAALKARFDSLDQSIRETSLELAYELDGKDVSVVIPSDGTYPERLRDLQQPPPFLFWWGNLGLARRRGVGMCGSRDASERGLRYARLFGRSVVDRGLQVISGYARGVDMETHLGALEAGGSTIIVLAEGITHFRRKRAFASFRFDKTNVLAISQFPPTQSWTAGAAMTRNAVIAGLARAMLVVEARERGGTLNAGLQAIDIGRPVFAIAYSDDPPAGNEILFGRGAQPLRSQNELLAALDHLAYADESKQLALGD
jgi:DNA processing protein